MPDESWLTSAQADWLRDNPSMAREMADDATRVVEWLDAEDAGAASAGRLADRLERLYTDVPAGRNPEIDQRRYDTTKTVSAGLQYLRTVR